jgi:hypothetical protein
VLSLVFVLFFFFCLLGGTWYWTTYWPTYRSEWDNTRWIVAPAQAAPSLVPCSNYTIRGSYRGGDGRYETLSEPGDSFVARASGARGARAARGFGTDADDDEDDISLAALLPHYPKSGRGARGASG